MDYYVKFFNSLCWVIVGILTFPIRSQFFPVKNVPSFKNIFIQLCETVFGFFLRPLIRRSTAVLILTFSAAVIEWLSDSFCNEHGYLCACLLLKCFCGICLFFVWIYALGLWTDGFIRWVVVGSGCSRQGRPVRVKHEMHHDQNRGKQKT